MIHDNTELKQINSIHSRLSASLEQTLNEIYLFDIRSLRFDYVNRCAQRNLGYDMETLRTMTPLHISPDLDEISFRKLADSLLHGEKDVLIFDTVHMRADSTTYPVEVHLQLFEQLERAQFLAIMVDITI